MVGGFGRSLAKWMMAQGARSFMFLADLAWTGPKAKVFIDDLREQGAVVEVVRGDVGNHEDVEHAVQAAQLPIGGVDPGCYGSE